MTGIRQKSSSFRVESDVAVRGHGGRSQGHLTVSKIFLVAPVTATIIVAVLARHAN
jgi:hypothetical protein